MGASARYGRDNELEADKFGVNRMAAAGYDVNGAVELQETFVKLSKGRQNDSFSNFFAGLPPKIELIKIRIELSIFPKAYVTQKCS